MKMMHMFLIIFVANKLTFGMLIFFILKFLCIKKKKNLKEKIKFSFLCVNFMHNEAAS